MKFNPKDFLDKPHIYLFNYFKEKVLSEAVEIENVPEINWDTYELKEQLNDFQIEKEFPNCVFEDVSKFCAYLYALIEKQKNGENGLLLNNGYANLFYVKTLSEVMVVIVSWSADVREWNVNANRRDDFQWFAGDRVFRSNFDSQSPSPKDLSTSDSLALETRVKTLEEQMEKLRKFLII